MQVVFQQRASNMSQLPAKPGFCFPVLAPLVPLARPWWLGFVTLYQRFHLVRVGLLQLLIAPPPDKPGDLELPKVIRRRAMSNWSSPTLTRWKRWYKVTKPRAGTRNCKRGGRRGAGKQKPGFAGVGLC